MKRLELQTSLLPCGGDTGLVVNTLLPESSVSRAVDLDEDEDGVTRRYLEIGMSAGHQQCLNMMNEGIRSLLEVDCPRLSALVSLNLYSNRVASLEGLSSMTVSRTTNQRRRCTSVGCGQSNVPPHVFETRYVCINT